MEIPQWIKTSPTKILEKDKYVLNINNRIFGTVEDNDIFGWDSYVQLGSICQNRIWVAAASITPQEAQGKIHEYLLSIMELLLAVEYIQISQ